MRSSIRRWAGDDAQGEGIRHIARLADDIISSVRILRENGVIFAVLSLVIASVMKWGPAPVYGINAFPVARILQLSYVKYRYESKRPDKDEIRFPGPEGD